MSLSGDARRNSTIFNQHADQRHTMKASAIIALAILLCAVGASTVQVISPTSQYATSATDTIDLGIVGPGQTLAVVISNATWDYNRLNPQLTKMAAWDVLQVDDASLPAGWKGENSGKYLDALKANIIVAPAAQDGVYDARMQASSDYQGIPALEFGVQATVSRDVFGMTITKEPVKVAPRENTEIEVELSNTASASDVFQVNLTGLPKELEQTKTVLVPYKSKVRVQFNFQAPEAGQYDLKVNAASQSSGEINAQASTSLYVGTSLTSDAMAASRGVLLFPTPQGLAYSAISLVTAIFG